MAEKYIYQEYPKMLYHRKHGHRAFNSAKETKWLWLKGWRTKPFPQGSRGIGGLWQFWLDHWPVLLPVMVALLGIAVALFIHFDSKANIR